LHKASTITAAALAFAQAWHTITGIACEPWTSGTHVSIGAESTTTPQAVRLAQETEHPLLCNGVGGTPQTQRVDECRTVVDIMLVERHTKGVGKFRNVHAITRGGDNLQNLHVREAHPTERLHIVFAHFPGIPSHLFAELQHGVFLRVLDDLAPIVGDSKHFVQRGPTVLTEKLSV
jgi:hypothetical protein